MAAFETILIMLAASVLLLALAGTAVAVARVPIDVGPYLDPRPALALFVAPVLLDAAYDTSLRVLKRHCAGDEPRASSSARTASGYLPSAPGYRRS